MKIGSPLLLALLLPAAILSPGCQRDYLVAPPVNFHNTGGRPFRDVPPELQTDTVDVIFATDRIVNPRAANPANFSWERSLWMKVGRARLRIGENLSWEKLVAVSCDAPAAKPKIRVEEVDVRAWYPSEPIALPHFVEKHAGHVVTPSPLEMQFTSQTPPQSADNRAMIKRTAASQPVPRTVENAREQLHAMLREQLAKTGRKEVFLFIHGFNVCFDESVATVGQLWHYLGRVGVPVAYSWPGGKSGATSYPYDRESGEFTVRHLKRFLQDLAACPEVEKINVVAHSRGADVYLTALRELHIANRAAGKSTREALKLNHLILAAPDLDAMLASQRILAENIHETPRRLTLYFSPDDWVLFVSELFFGGLPRVGRLDERLVPNEYLDYLKRQKGLEIIAVTTRDNGLGHAYFIENPGVLADMILLLRDNAPAGSSARPLKPNTPPFWELDKTYLKK